MVESVIETGAARRVEPKAVSMTTVVAASSAGTASMRNVASCAATHASKSPAAASASACVSA